MDQTAKPSRISGMPPGPTTPAPAVVFRLDEAVVMVVVLMRMVTRRVRTIASLRQSHCWALSVAGADAREDDLVDSVIRRLRAHKHT
jgi:hypothetical protein